MTRTPDAARVRKPVSVARASCGCLCRLSEGKWGVVYNGGACRKHRPGDVIDRG